MTIIEAFDDPELFGQWFSGPSWNAWRAILKAAFALPMSDDEVELFRSVAQRDPPPQRVRELWIVAGRRAGKDSVASMLATWFAAFVDYERLLRPGEMASILALAVDRQQAKIVLRYARSYFEQIGMLQPLITRETADGFELATRAEFLVLASNYRSVRGRSIPFAILDECAFLRSEESATPDTEVYAAIVPGMATIPGSMLVGISSPYRRAGLLYEKWRDCYGKDDPDVLVIQAPSRVLNPTLPEKIVTDALARDPAAARAEWLAEWRDDIASFMPRELIEDAVDDGVIVRPPVPGVSYFSFCDPSGGASDSFAAAVTHSEGDSVILDCLVEIPAPFNPAAATAQIADTLKSYRLRDTIGDRYAASWVVESFEKHGVTYRHSERDRSALYADALPMFTSGRARILDNRRLVTQLASLERRTSRSGRDSIDHPAGAHDDLANAAAGAIAAAAGRVEPGFIGYYRELALYN